MHLAHYLSVGTKEIILEVVEKEIFFEIRLLER